MGTRATRTWHNQNPKSKDPRTKEARTWDSTGSHFPSYCPPSVAAPSSSFDFTRSSPASPIVHVVLTLSPPVHSQQTIRFAQMASGRYPFGQAAHGHEICNRHGPVRYGARRSDGLHGSASNPLLCPALLTATILQTVMFSPSAAAP